MKNFITPSLLKFALAATVLTATFRCALSYGIGSKAATIVILSTVLHFIGMFISGWYFGKKDGNYLPIYDVGFRFHFVTYVVHNLISELWFIFGLNSHYEKIEAIHLTAAIWGIFLLLHFLLFLRARKKSFNGLDKKELFE